MDKKNEDYVVRMDDKYGSEKDPFMARSPLRKSHNGAPLPISVTKLDNSPPLSVLSYCLSSISMTVVNKYVVSGNFWNLNFFYLTVQVSYHVLGCSMTRRSSSQGRGLYPHHLRMQATRPHQGSGSFRFRQGKEVYVMPLRTSNSILI